MAFSDRSRSSPGGGGGRGSGTGSGCRGTRGGGGGVGGGAWSLLRWSCSPQLVCLLYLLLVLCPPPCRPVTNTTGSNVTPGATPDGAGNREAAGTANQLLPTLEERDKEAATKETEDPAVTLGQPQDDDAGGNPPPPSLTPTPTPPKPPTSTTVRNNGTAMHSSKVIIETKQGRMGGIAVKVDDDVTTRFLGVPYAAPPVGELRFKPPQKHSWKQEKGWSFRSIWNATKVKPACPRDLTAWRYPFSLDRLYGDMVSKVETSEDCLYLNIFVPRNLSSMEHINTLALPVMVYLHDGHLRTEHSLLRNAWRFARDGHVIVATIGFRVDVLGYFSLMDSDAEGNFGLRDQTLALHWIWDNIREFGGDPDKITIFGSGHGGIDVGYHVLSQQSRGLFVRAISQSGSVLSRCCRQKKPIGAASSLARTLSCPVSPHSEMMKCLRKAPLGHLMTASQKTAKRHGQWWPVVDGQFIADDPLRLLQAGTFNPVDYIIGANSHDGYETIKDMHIDLDRDVSNDGLEDLVRHFVKKYFSVNIEQVTRALLTEYHFCALNVTQLGQSLVDFLTDMDYFAPAELAARYLSRNVNRRVFLYEFAHRPSYASGARPPFIAAHHLDDLEYVTGDVRYVIRNVTQAERQLSQALMSAWTNFARTGYESFNLLEDELEGVLGVIEGHQLPSSSKKRPCCEDPSHPPPKVAKSTWSDRFRYQLFAEDNSERIGEETYIRKQNCVDAGEVVMREGEKLEIVTEKVKATSPADILSKTYGYILKREYVLKIREKREEGQTMSQPRDNHTDLPVVPDQVALRAAHIRISAQRLCEAAAMMYEVYEEAGPWATVHNAFEVLENPDYDLALTNQYEGDYKILDKF